MKVITLANQKGGCGKTTTAQLLSVGLVNKGFNVLAIDCDAQCNLSSVFGLMSSNKTKGTLLDVMNQEADISDCVYKIKIGLDVLSGNPKLNNADKMYSEFEDITILNDALEKVKNKYDYVVIDTPPALGVLTINALTASNYAIIPAQADIYSLQGITQLNSTIQVVQKYTNPALKVLGIVLTRYNARATLTRELTDLLENTAGQLDTKVFKTRIRENIAVKEAQAVKQNLYTYAPKSNASKDYTALVEEIETDIIF